MATQCRLVTAQEQPFQNLPINECIGVAGLTWTTTQTWLEWNTTSLAGVGSSRQALVVEERAALIMPEVLQQTPVTVLSTRCCWKLWEGTRRGLRGIRGRALFLFGLG
ncbi:unnamed protein product [Symbiodinium sp. CCMP2592]|nr:unnamed protein product [Symbiodinium sp. CCMP2592]